MAFVTTRDGIDLYVTEAGKGRPVVLIHGWPLHSGMWEYQSLFLAEQGLRPMAYDRRGFGQSDKPDSGYDYDTLADDLHAVMEAHDLEDAVLVGFSMGGGEVVRYLAKHGSKRVSKAVLLGAVAPFMLKTDSNPGGVDGSVFEGMRQAVRKDRAQFFKDFTPSFMGTNRVPQNASAGQVEQAFGMAMQSCLPGMLHCITAFGETDFRDDMAKLDVPLLILHGDEDQTVPAEVSAIPASKLSPHATLQMVKGAPHGLYASHRDEVNEAILRFIRS